MDSFLFNPKPNSLRGVTVMNRHHEPEAQDQAEAESETEISQFTATLEIHIHYARNIHNICIYDNQDVYAKFSLTYNPDETLSTSIIEGGGKNPDFNQSLVVKVNQPDAVLKCEMWMLSRARNYMEDQLLGFSLVPLSGIASKGKVTADYSLSSTDLIHSPAGTVRLSLKLDTSPPLDPSQINPVLNLSSIASEVVILDRKKGSEVDLDLDPIEYSRIEFPDINVAVENQQMVSEYFTSNSRNNNNSITNIYPGGIIASFLHLGSSPLPFFESDASGNLSEISTTTSLSDDRNSADSTEKKPIVSGCEEPSSNRSNSSEDTPTSRKVNEVRVEEKVGSNVTSNLNEGQNSNFKVFTTDLEAEQSAMQQQIVGMYMRSMQQFTESLAKMKLPLDLDKIEREDKLDIDSNKKKDGSRVFYGSRAFF